MTVWLTRAAQNGRLYVCSNLPTHDREGMFPQSFSADCERY